MGNTMKQKVNRVTTALLLILLFFPALVMGQWRFAKDMPEPRAGAAAVVFNNAIYLFGGKTTGDTLLNTVAKFDLTTMEWTTSDIPPFTFARYNAAAIVYNNEIYLIGGADAQNRSLRQVEIYSPVQKKWRHAHALRKERNGAIAVVLRNKLYVLGGSKNSWYDYPEDIEWYDANQNRWEEADGDLDEGVAAPFFGMVNDTIFLFGGYYIQPTADAHKGYLKNTNKFEWEDFTPLSQARAYGASVQINDSLFLIGGVDQQGNGVGTVEVFDLRNHTFSAAPPLQIARSGAAGVYAAGRIFIFGGYNADNSQILKSVEYYGDVITGITTPRPIGTMPNTFIQVKGYPNPFNGIVHLKLILQQSGFVEVSIYNLQGQLIQNIFQGKLTAGNHQFVWNALNGSNQPVASGTYLAVVKTGQYRKVVKLLLLK